MITLFLVVVFSGAEARAGDLRVIDGDTIRLDGETIRIANIDTPEKTFRAECLAEKMLGAVATRRLTDLLAAGDFEVISDGEKDYYGRLLATVALADGRDVGEILISEDLAGPWTGRQVDWCG